MIDSTKRLALRAFWAGVAMLVLLSLGIQAAIYFSDNPPAPDAAPSPAEIRKRQIQALVNHAEAQLVAHIKASMHDPDSFELVGDRAIDAGDHITMVMTCRGRNGFNAVRLERVAATFDLQGNLTYVGKIE